MAVRELCKQNSHVVSLILKHFRFIWLNLHNLQRNLNAFLFVVYVMYSLSFKFGIFYFLCVSAHMFSLNIL